MGIHPGKVLTGGLAAGVVMNVIDFVVNGFILMDRNKAQMDALNPALNVKMESTSSIVTFILIDFAYGLLITFAYAAMRPRFGAGAGTAIKAGLLMWMFGAATWAYSVAMGMFTWTDWMIGAVAAFVSMMAGAYVGAMLYSEPA